MTAPGATPAAPTSAAPDSPLARRNPTVKLGLVVVISVVMLFVVDPVTAATLYGLALAAVVLGSRIPARTLLVAHGPFVAFASGLLTVNALSRPGVELWSGGPLQVTVEGLTIGAALALRTLVIGVLSIGFVLSTDAVTLMTSLHHNARLGARTTYAVLAGYRMLQEMPREWSTIRHAHAVRARLRPDGSLPLGVRDLTRVAFTLLVVSIRKGERMAQSLESRGLGLSPRTTWRPVAVHRADWVLAGGVLAVVAVVLLASAQLGFLRGVGALTS